MMRGVGFTTRRWRSKGAKFGNVRRIQRLNCERKRFYATEEEARCMAMAERYRLRKDVREYMCTVCGGWHLTATAFEERRT